MTTFNQYMSEYKKQMKKGDIQNAYRGIMEYIMRLRTHFQKKYPDHYVSGSLYYGYMDMTYFSFIPQSLKQLKLKIAIVFIHDTCSFELWLAAVNKQEQNKYWNIIKEKKWNKYRIPPSIKGIDSIIEFPVVSDPDFSDLDIITDQIEVGTMQFIKDIEQFLS